ncbi:Zn-ribbon domain-containing OB-fold protein [Mycolicibacterium hodleri]|uniref:Zn-ribbon domain-containing OB-fold protein n=1 Tax=Mycolicibacterium hodleri TaxID=49897 RepID=UPI001877C4DE|nr:OB-fold domain-containing protein [Mycolicibacterium hodleri]
MVADQLSNDELVQRFPGEPITHDNAAHYRGRLRRELLVNRCDDCRLWHAPPKPMCPECWSWNVTPLPVSGNGAIFMNVFLYQGPPAPGVDYSTPYPVVTVELEEQVGLRFTATVADADNGDIQIGKAVRLDWRDRAGSPMPVFVLTGADA